MREVFSRVARVASSSCTVLITGETGTGKELVAQAIHYSGRHATRAAGRRELRGPPRASAGKRVLRPRTRGLHRSGPPEEGPVPEQAKGRYAPARRDRRAPLGMQAKLLRVLQDGTFERVGGSEVIQAECRILAATNLNLAEAVAAGRFREDLFYRLNVVSIELPAAPRPSRRHPLAR